MLYYLYNDTKSFFEQNFIFLIFFILSNFIQKFIEIIFLKITIKLPLIYKPNFGYFFKSRKIELPL